MKYKRLLAIVLLGVSLIGCGDSKVGNTKVDKDKAEAVAKGEVKKDSNGSTIDVDEYIYGSSYQDLISQDRSLLDLVTTVKLRKPLKALGSMIEETPPDSEFEHKEEKAEDRGKDNLIDSKDKTTDKVVDEKDKGEGVKDKYINPDHIKDKIELPKPKEFLFDLQNYVNNQLMNNGYMLIYSESNTRRNYSDTELNGIIHRLKISTESLKTKDSYIKTLYKGNKNILESWSSLYNQLMKAQAVLNKINNVETLLQHNREIDFTSLYNFSNDFNNKATDILKGYIPGVTEEETNNVNVKKNK